MKNYRIVGVEYLRNITEKDIQDLLLRCHNNKNYRSCIILGTIKEVNDFLKSMNTNAQDWVVKRTVARIEFKNGSFIDVRSAGSGEIIRGKRYHSFIQDNVLPKEVVEVIMSSYLIPYYEEEEAVLDTKDDSALDNFLDEFNINN